MNNLFLKTAQIKYLFLLIFSLFALNINAQNKKSIPETIDEHALSDTYQKGSVGAGSTAMSEYATKEMVAALTGRVKTDFLLFPEHRENPIRLLDGIPSIWALRDVASMHEFSAEVYRGEYFTFQVGLFAPNQRIENIAYRSSGLNGITCFNTEGTDLRGKPLKKRINVEAGSVQPLWFGIKIPLTADSIMTGSISISADNQSAQTIQIRLKIKPEVISNEGVDDSGKLARLKWLNSTIALDNRVTGDFSEIRQQKRKISITGRELVIGKDGLPEAINSFFEGSNYTLSDQSSPLLTDRIRFVAELMDGRLLHFKTGAIHFSDPAPDNRSWSLSFTSDEMEILLDAKIEFDGVLTYQLRVIPGRELAIKDLRLEIPMTKDKSVYLMGMDKEGGFRPATWEWKWDVEKKSQDMVWIGGVNGGLRLKLFDDQYHKQLVNIYYEHLPLRLPTSWGNNGKGGVQIRTTDRGTSLTAYSGQRTVAKSDTLHFNFELLITPLKLMNREIQFGEHYYHNSGNDLSASFISDAEAIGANIINIHHKKDINPFINYPMLNSNRDALSRFVDQAHQHNLKVKLYYTTRELTINTPEIWAFRSLQGEILFPGPASAVRNVINPDGPHPWLVKNFKTNYIPAWKCTFMAGPYKGQQDLAVITTPDTRLNNFYLEGLDWMCKNFRIDGIYIDDSSLDRLSLRRARKILGDNCVAPRIDMHIWNSYREIGNYCHATTHYLDLFPYIDLLWVGEGRSYNTAPDYWLTEISGIPFGLPSQMLKDGGNRWRGMVFGMTNRAGWYGPTPEHIWRFWKEEKIKEMTMMGFWESNPPVRTGNPSIKATLYKGKTTSLLAIANWTGTAQTTGITINWKQLGINPDRVSFSIPAITDYQKEGVWDGKSPLTLDAERGLIIKITTKE